MPILRGSQNWIDVEDFLNYCWLQEGSVLHRICLREREGEQSENTQSQQCSGYACKPLAVKTPTGVWKDVSVCSLFNQGVPLNRGVQKEWISSCELEAKIGEAALTLAFTAKKNLFSRIVHIGGQKKNQTKTCLFPLYYKGEDCFLTPIIFFHCLSKSIKFQPLLLYFVDQFMKIFVTPTLHWQQSQMS